MEGKSQEQKDILNQYRSKGEQYICACLNKNNSTNVRRTPGGLLYTRRWNNMQYVSTSVFLLTLYSDHLQSTDGRLNCDKDSVSSDEILSFVKSQVHYILGSNPMGLSYALERVAHKPNPWLVGWLVGEGIHSHLFVTIRETMKLLKKP
ncbi:endoglucanase 11-like [Dorcoceras hygrometricum]|nr:endoglucanase 11-like [Dorcoceras hygrometricum]